MSGADSIFSRSSGDSFEDAPPPVTPSASWFWSIVKPLPFFLMHAACLLALVVPFSWSMVGLAVGMYYLRMFGLSTGYHRYFSHRSFKTSRVFQFVLAWLGAMCLQKG